MSSFADDTQHFFRSKQFSKKIWMLFCWPHLRKNVFLTLPTDINVVLISYSLNIEGLGLHFYDKLICDTHLKTVIRETYMSLKMLATEPL